MRFVCVSLRRCLCLIGAAVILVLSVVGIRFTGASAVFFGGTNRSLPIYCVERRDKNIAISFDCAWGTEHTDEILKVLKDNDITATFFMVEFWAKKYPEYVKKIADSGCEIGTHSSSHSYMSKLTEGEIRAELESSSLAISKVTGRKVELFRPPYGDYDDLLIDTAKSMGLYSIQWSVDSLDWKDLSATDIAMRIINGTQAGSIILCHNNGKHTAEALPIVIDTLKNRGYNFVNIGDLIYRGDNAIDPSGKQLIAADAA